MTFVKPVPGRGRADQSQVRPRVPLFADFRRGISDAISGQKLDVVRSSNTNVQASNGVSYSVGANQPALSYTVKGIGLTGPGVFEYNINPQIRLSGQPPIPFQVAWHGLLPTTGASDSNAIWHIGDSSANNRLSLQVITGGVSATYVNNAGASSTDSVTGLVVQREIYIVVQMIPVGASDVQVRLAVKRRVAFDDLPWEYGTAGSAVECGLAFSSNKLRLHRLPGLTVTLEDAVTYRILMQNGTADVDDLVWGWEAREPSLPGVYGLVDDTTFVYPELDVATDLFFQDDPSYIFINVSGPSDYLLTEPLGTASPFLTLEPTT
jgi:hypothetical protein